MYTVVLVDDEIWSLEGLTGSINWDKYGFQVVGKFTNSLESFDYICEKKPDVVFTDIRMPDMSGIDLIERARNEKLETLFVVVSGFAEFSYAQKALSNGAFEYLLKPVREDEANDVLRRLKYRLDEQKISADNAKLKRLQAAKENIQTDKVSYQYVIAITSRTANVLEDYNIERWLQEHDIIADVFYISNTCKIFVISMGITETLFRELHKLLVKETFMKIYVGISYNDTKQGAIIKGIKEALDSASGYYLGKPSEVFVYSDVHNDVFESNIHELKRALSYNDYQSVIDGILTLGTDIKQHGLGINACLRIWNEIIILLLDKRVVLKAFDLQYFDVFQLLNRFVDLDDEIDALIHLLNDYLVIENVQHEGNEYNKSFMQLLHYVDHHYQEKLSLSELSQMFYLNTTYCSELFKKVTGENFSGYVTRLRMHKADGLLREGKYSVREVAEMVAFSDPFYFSKVYKKYYGYLPTERI